MDPNKIISVIVYHGGDFDGIGAGLLVDKAFRNNNPSIITYPVAAEYGHVSLDSQWFKEIIAMVKDGKPVNTLAMVDYHLPLEMVKEFVEAYKKVNDMPPQIMLIDHHQVDPEYLAYIQMNYGEVYLRPFGISAIGIAWHLGFPYDMMPRMVRYATLYDSWNHDVEDWDETILPFKYGFDSIIHFPKMGKNLSLADHKQEFLHNIDNGVLQLLLFDQTGEFGKKITYDSVIQKGKNILSWWRRYQKNTVDNYAYTAHLSLPDDDAIAIEVIACNTSISGSYLYEHYDVGNHAMVTWHYDPRQDEYVYHVYSDNDTEPMKASEIACRFGGGGHLHAARFMSKKLVLTPVKEGNADGKDSKD